MAYFDQNDSLGAKSPDSIAAYLMDIGDSKASGRFSGQGAGGQGLTGYLMGIDQYRHTGILIGYIPPGGKGQSLEIENAFSLSPDTALKRARVKITLDKFFVHNYPGMGAHSILCEFAGKNQIVGDSEEMRFALTATATDGGSAALSGAPIFLGVTVGDDGIAFEGRTINVRSSVDDTLMGALGSDAFKNGLALLTSAQPALKPFVGLAASVVKSIAARNKNCQVYSFKLGLDFSNSSTSASLRLGSYIVVQADENTWDWSNIVWDGGSQSMQMRSTRAAIPFNYMVFGVSAFS